MPRWPGRHLGAPSSPDQGGNGETEANRLELLQQVCTGNSTRDQPPGFPFSESMGCLCCVKEEKYPEIQNTHGNRQTAKFPKLVLAQEKAIVGAIIIQ